MRTAPAAALLTALLPAAAATADVAFAEKGKTLEITVSGKPLTTYRFGNEDGAAKPFFWPVAGPHGDPVTRAFPNVKGVPGETADHPHHRGLHFTHGEVARPGKPWVDFWAESAKVQGKIVHKAFDPAPAASGGMLAFGVRNEWLAPDGETLVDEHTRWTITDLGNGEALFTAVITLAPAGGPVAFLDTKEGSLCFRVATSMDEKKAKPATPGLPTGGRIVGSGGATGEKECWGKPADWIDYVGPVAGKTVGVAIFDHPGNKPRVRWHVRAYGLFAANPFGSAAFNKANPKSELTLEPGQTLTLRYGVLIHAGDTKEGKVAERYAEFVKAAESGK
jgi:hypothetical protein